MVRRFFQHAFYRKNGIKYFAFRRKLVLEIPCQTDLRIVVTVVWELRLTPPAYSQPETREIEPSSGEQRSQADLVDET